MCALLRVCVRAMHSRACEVGVGVFCAQCVGGRSAALGEEVTGCLGPRQGCVVEGVRAAIEDL